PRAGSPDPPARQAAGEAGAQSHARTPSGRRTPRDRFFMATRFRDQARKSGPCRPRSLESFPQLAMFRVIAMVEVKLLQSWTRSPPNAAFLNQPIKMLWGNTEEQSELCVARWADQLRLIHPGWGASRSLNAR